MSVLFIAGILNCGSKTACDLIQVQSSLEFICTFALKCLSLKILKLHWYFATEGSCCDDRNWLLFLSSEFCENLTEDSRETIIMAHILPCVKVKCFFIQRLSTSLHTATFSSLFQYSSHLIGVQFHSRISYWQITLESASVL